MAASRSQVLSLYKRMLRESKNFSNYNFRTYAVEKTQHEFRANKAVTDPEMLSALLNKAQENLAMIKRQVVIGQMYSEGHLVIEQPAGENKT